MFSGRLFGLGLRVTGRRGESASVLPGLHYERAVADTIEALIIITYTILGGPCDKLGSDQRAKSLKRAWLLPFGVSQAL